MDFAELLGFQQACQQLVAGCASSADDEGFHEKA